MPEYNPKGMAFIPDQYLENREADIACNQGCNLGATLSALDAIKVAKKHEKENDGHIVTVTEVICFDR